MGGDNDNQIKSWVLTCIWNKKHNAENINLIEFNHLD